MSEYNKTPYTHPDNDGEWSVEPSDYDGWHWKASWACLLGVGATIVWVVLLWGGPGIERNTVTQEGQPAIILCSSGGPWYPARADGDCYTEDDPTFVGVP
jgi:hypothetical protein